MSKKPKIRIKDKSYDPISYIVKTPINALLGTNFKVRRTYTYEENGVEKREQTHSFSEFVKKKNL